ncbi:Uncharacterised protein [Bordetella pertussis]|nr:Uncharacterised protein [Bordetella pertussis]
MSTCVAPPGTASLPRRLTSHSFSRNAWPVLPCAASAATTRSMSRSMASSASWATPGWSRSPTRAMRWRSRSCSTAPLMSVRSLASSRSNREETAIWCSRASPSRAKKNNLSNRYSRRR